MASIVWLIAVLALPHLSSSERFPRQTFQVPNSSDRPGEVSGPLTVSTAETASVTASHLSNLTIAVDDSGSETATEALKDGSNSHLSSGKEEAISDVATTSVFPLSSLAPDEATSIPASDLDYEEVAPGMPAPTIDISSLQNNPETNSVENGCTLNLCDYVVTFCKPPQTCVPSSDCLSISCLDSVSVSTPVIQIAPTGDTQETTDVSTKIPAFVDSCIADAACQNGATCQNMECICPEGFTGLLCNDVCDLRCVHGQCAKYENRTFCNCEHNYIGLHCDKQAPDPEKEGRILAAILASALAVALVLAIIIPVILWRMRVIFVMRLIYFLKEYEDDDGKEYDAYVSQTSTATADNFVYGLLRPHLESLGFKLYLQARDCPVGDVMSEAILAALEKSRRTIMIITPDYIHNEWNRFEYLIAQQETLKLQQRIIPIILDDIDRKNPNLDKSLKHILDSIKCLRFPQISVETSGLLGGQTVSHADVEQSNTYEVISPTNSESPLSDPKSKKLQAQEKRERRFWKRLELTMPKKKKSDERSPAGQPKGISKFFLAKKINLQGIFGLASGSFTLSQDKNCTLSSFSHLGNKSDIQNNSFDNKMNTVALDILEVMKKE